MDEYVVYVKPDGQNRITAVNSSAFLQGTQGWTPIDSGYGDRYHHAQGNYFPKPVIDERGIYRYKLVGSLPVERTAEEMDGDYVEIDTPTADQRITALEEENRYLKEALDLLLSGATEVQDG